MILTLDFHLARLVNTVLLLDELYVAAGEDADEHREVEFKEWAERESSHLEQEEFGPIIEAAGIPPRVVPKPVPDAHVRAPGAPKPRIQFPSSS